MYVFRVSKRNKDGTFVGKLYYLHANMNKILR